MPSVTIDAGVLAAPPKDGSADDAHRYVETLLSWSKLLANPWVAIYMSERASETLVDDGLYPIRAHLNSLFTTNGIVEYDSNTIAIVVDRLLERIPSFEDYFCVRDVLTEELTTEPDILRGCSGARLQSELERCVVLIAILRTYCEGHVQDHSLILRNAPEKSIRVRALIQVLDQNRTDLVLTLIPTLPKHFEGGVLVCDNLKGFIECLDEVEILRGATDNVGVETAIRIAVNKFRWASGKESEWDYEPAVRVGPAFRSLFQTLPPTQQLRRSLLRAIVETLEKTNLSATHQIRMGPGGDDPQRVRKSDQAKAWRRDIDRDHHLHYWECKDGTMEIASVSFPHDDFTIPE